MPQNLAKMQVISGFRRVSGWLLGFAWLVLVFGGLAIITSPPPPPPILGWTLLSVAAVVLVVTMDKWVTAFPGLVAYGAFSSVLMLVDGHAVNHPEVAVSRIEAIANLLFFAGAAALSVPLAKRSLTIPDRIALLVFVLCFFAQAAFHRFIFASMALGVAFMLCAWTYDQLLATHRIS